MGDPGQWRLWVAALWSLAGLAITFAAVRRAPRIAYGLVFFLVASLPVLGLRAVAGPCERKRADGAAWWRGQGAC